ncbi:MAG: alkaline phosphatase D family protein, partial [Caulobacterales bacterium]|nr:alkaline phosphatase D family protein [Caulobacterales bacterium]
LAWQVARDEAFADILREGTVRAEASRDWTAKVDVDGLEPGGSYFYRFRSGDETSPVGRTRTLPAGRVDRFTMAAMSCSNIAAGWFNVYRDVAARGDIDLVLHLGDYFYEHAPGGYATGWGMERGRAPSPAKETVTLADYRGRHAQYKTDPDLQALHAAAPWVTIWDDHESTNDSHAAGAENHQPETEGDWSARKTAAIRAYFEWMPIREPTPGRARSAIWRSFEIGDLATLIMLETRLTARSPGIELDAAPIPADADPADPDARAAMAVFLADVVGDPGRQMLGAEQEAFVADALARSTAAGKPWQVLGNQVLLGRVTSPNYVKSLPGWLKWVIRQRFPFAWDPILRSQFDIPLSLDSWDGYPAARERLYAAARAAEARLIALTGDTHCFYTNRLTDDAGAARGVEFATSSVTSPSEFNLAAAPGVDFGELTERASGDVIHHNAYDRGYAVLTLTPDEALCDYVRIDTVTARDYRADAYRRHRLTPAEPGRMTYEELGA